MNKFISFDFITKDIKIMTGKINPIITGKPQIKKQINCSLGSGFILGIPLIPGDLFEKRRFERA